MSRNMGRGYGDRGERSELADRVVRVNRVAKVVKGGRKFSFSALIVVGDMNGRVGAGIGKAREVTEAIRKGMEVAKRNMITVPMVGTTIPHAVEYKWGAARIMLKPAAPGTGVISGGAMRAVIETAGIKDILTKSHGTNNPINDPGGPADAEDCVAGGRAARQGCRADGGQAPGGGLWGQHLLPTRCGGGSASRRRGRGCLIKHREALPRALGRRRRQPPEGLPGRSRPP